MSKTALTSKQKKRMTQVGQARQKKDGSWWFCVRSQGASGRWIYMWPIGNTNTCNRSGITVKMVKPAHSKFCFIQLHQQSLF